MPPLCAVRASSGHTRAVVGPAVATGHHPAALHAPPFGLASVGQRGRPGEQLSTLLPTSQGGGWRSRPHPDGRSEPAEAPGGGPCEAVSACVFAPQFEQENQRLIGEMNSLCDEVRYVRRGPGTCWTAPQDPGPFFSHVGAQASACGPRAI